jgi:hypothetical protein
LIEHKVDINQIDSLKKRAALHWAVVAQNFEIVSMLVEAGKKLNPTKNPLFN